MNKPKRIQLDPSKLLGARHLDKTKTKDKIDIAKAMVGGVKGCTSPT